MNQKELFESILNEGDCGGCEAGTASGNTGGMCASSFASQVPENMGAVVGPGKHDKKYSDVFGENAEESNDKEILVESFLDEYFALKELHNKDY